MRLFRWFGLLSLAAVACSRGTGSSELPGDTDPVVAGDSDGEAESGAEGDVEGERLLPGISHSGLIDKVAICADGSCALTRDQTGGVRLWPSLDGRSEPQIVPVRGASVLSGARVELDPGGPLRWTVFAVEPAGSAKLLSISVDGKSTELAALPPFEPVASAAVRPGGHQVAVLYRSGDIALLDESGKKVATFDERKFKPTAIRLSADGKRLIAVSTLARKAGNFQFELTRLAISEEGGTTAIKRDGPPRIVSSTVDLDTTTLAIDPVGARAAVAVRGSGDHWEYEVFLLGRDKDPTKGTVKVVAHVTPQLGFVGKDQILFSTNNGGSSVLVDLAKNESRTRTSIPQDFNHQGKVQAFAPGRQVVGYGTYLFVHDVDTRAHRFLGYKSLQAAAATVSPSRSHVAWAYIQGPVYIEPLDQDSDDATVTIDLESNFGQQKMRFADDDHLIVVDSNGGVRLYEWRTGKLIDEAGVLGQVRQVQFDPQTQLLLVDRNVASHVYEVSVTEGFTGPYIVSDQAYRMSLLAAKKSDDPVLWTLDPKNKQREYTLAELRSDLSREVTEKMGEALESGQPSPLAVDNSGRQYGVRWNGSQLELFVERGSKLATRPLPAGDVNSIVPSPTRDRFLVGFNRSGTHSVSLYETSSMTPLWSYSTGVFISDVTWSQDGTLLTLASVTGAVVLDTESGVAAARRCGLEFTASAGLPNNAFNSPNQRSMCEM